MSQEEMYELSNESDNILRSKLENGDIAPYTFKRMLKLDYLTQDRYNRITRSYEGLDWF